MFEFVVGGKQCPNADLRGNLNGVTGGVTTTYSYHANGNRNMSGYTTGAHTGNEMTSDGTWNYSYDAKGNITEKDLIVSHEYWTYAYDNRNELTEAKHYNNSLTLVLTADYEYDVFGNRIESDVISGSTTTTTRYAMNGWNPATFDGTGNDRFSVYAELNGSNALTTKNLSGDNTDELIARIDSTAPYRAKCAITSLNWQRVEGR